MSDLRIALVAEGPTDFVIIEAALKAILPGAFILTQLQPEASLPEMGNGWGGVLKWCHAASQRHAGPVDQDPTLAGFDLIIIHLDVDVAAMDYGNLGQEVAALVQPSGWGVLPCAHACPPVTDTVNALSTVLQSWLGQATVGSRTVLCLPAQSSGTWLAASLLPADHALLANAECDPRVENGLAQLPKAMRVKKTRRDYQLKAAALTQNWDAVKTICGQALVFETEVQTACP